MKSPITRRSFLTRTTTGLGAVALSKELSAFTRPTSMHGKKLLATTDYTDNIGHGLFTRAHLDSLHNYLKSIGVTRHQWIVDTIWNLYDQPQDGFDLLAEAVRSAHQHGMEFYAEIKPFEGGGFTDVLPHSLPLPDKKNAVKDIRGIHYLVRPFVAEHPHLCLQRRPGTCQFEGPITAIRLVKRDDKPTRVRPEHLSIWTSRVNSGFRKYDGPLSFRESVEWRPCFPKSQNCRILHMEKLQIPQDHAYVLIKCSGADHNGDFNNERGKIIEMENRNGDEIPFIVSTGPAAFETQRDNFNREPFSRIVRYVQQPEVQKLFADPEACKRHYQDFYGFDERQCWTGSYTLDREGYIAVACGKPEFMIGNLHPIYPEVRRHWLDMVRYCLDCGVDGINIRTANHTRSPEAWEYGFNEPVLKAAGGRTDYPAIRRINGNAYTQFLRETRDLVKSRNRSLTIHIYAQMLMPDDRPEYLGYIPPNFDWHWETWIREIADDLEFRGAWTLRPWNLRQAMETICAVIKTVDKPFYFQGNMKEIKYDWPLDITAAELDLVNQNPDMDGFVLYETAHFASMDKNASIKRNKELEQLLENYLTDSKD
jgi:hypothetical protein